MFCCINPPPPVITMETFLKTVNIEVNKCTPLNKKIPNISLMTSFEKE